MSGSAQTAHSPTQRLICKTLNILAYAELLGSAALEGLPTAQRRFPQVSASKALTVLNETLESRTRAMVGRPQRLWSCSWALAAGAKQIQRQLKRLREKNCPGASCHNKLGGAPSAFEQRRRRASGGVAHGGDGCSSAVVIETWGCPNRLMKVPSTSLRLQVCQRFRWSKHPEPTSAYQ